MSTSLYSFLCSFCSEFCFALGFHRLSLELSLSVVPSETLQIHFSWSMQNLLFLLHLPAYPAFMNSVNAWYNTSRFVNWIRCYQFYYKMNWVKLQLKGGILAFNFLVAALLLWRFCVGSFKSASLHTVSSLSKGLFNLSFLGCQQ